MSQLNCRLEMPNQKDSLAVNVGDRMPLLCSGSFQPALTSAARVIWTDPKMAHTLEIIEVRSASSQQVDFIVAGYRPGEYKLSLVIEEGQQKFETNEIDFKIESILDPSNQNPQPFPSKGPFRESYPMELWLALGGALVFCLALFVWGIFVRQKGRRLKNEMEQFKTFLSPMGQVSKDLREIQKRQGIVDSSIQSLVGKLDQAFRLYLVREFQIPAHQWTDSKVLKALRDKHRSTYEQCEPELRRLLRELASAKTEQAPLNAEDFDELLRLTRNLVEQLYSGKMGGAV